MSTAGIIRTILSRHGDELDADDIDALLRVRMDAYTEQVADLLGVETCEVCIEYKADGFDEVGWSFAVIYREQGEDIVFRFGWRGDHAKGATLRAAFDDVRARAASWREEAHAQWVEEVVGDEGGDPGVADPPSGPAEAEGRG